MIKLILIYIVFFFAFSCELFISDKEKKTFFETELLKKLYSLNQVDILTPSYFNNRKDIERPYYTFQDLLKFPNKLYLSYKTPMRNKNNGYLSLRNMKNGKVYASLENISNLQLFLYSKRPEGLKNIRDVKPLHLYLKFLLNGKIINIDIPLYSILPRGILIKSKIDFSLNNHMNKKNNSSLSLGTIPGLKFKNKGNIKKLIGSLDDDYSNSKITFCHRVNRSCQNLVTNKCRLCRYGSYQIVDYICPQGGSKICGVNECGKKGMPACMKGVTSLKLKPLSNDLCFDGSAAGFCGPGLSTVCDGRKILICL